MAENANALRRAQQLHSTFSDDDAQVATLHTTAPNMHMSRPSMRPLKSRPDHLIVPRAATTDQHCQLRL